MHSYRLCKQNKSNCHVEMIKADFLFICDTMRVFRWTSCDENVNFVDHNNEGHLER